MGYKPWRTLSVLVALGACMVGCTSGPQKGSSIGANNTPPLQKNQFAGQPVQQGRPGDQAAFNIPPKNNLPKIDTNAAAFPQAGAGQQQQNTNAAFAPNNQNQNAAFAPNNRPVGPTSEQFAPLPGYGGNSNVQQTSNSLGSINNQAAPVGGFAGERPGPISLPPQGNGPYIPQR